MTVNEVAKLLEDFAPLSLQEDYDNSGLLVGIPQMRVNGILLTIDITPDVVNEAVERKANLIVAHHPIIFKGIKRLNGSNYIERAVMHAIKNDIAIYAAHTNLDIAPNGVSHRIAQRLELSGIEVLKPLPNWLVKLVTFVPTAYAERVREALFSAGAGVIGNYDCCSYNIQGYGTFRAGEGTNPFVGEQGVVHSEPEVRVETVVPRNMLGRVVAQMLKVHPYEEVAYDIYPLELPYRLAGLGVVGNLPQPIPVNDFLINLKQTFNARAIRYTQPVTDTVHRVALCGGSGIELLSYAIAVNADVFITADVKYHQFFDADSRITIVDIGHFESEQFTVDIFYDLLSKKLPNFAIFKSELKTNPINYI